MGCNSFNELCKQLVFVDELRYNVVIKELIEFGLFELLVVVFKQFVKCVVIMEIFFKIVFVIFCMYCVCIRDEVLMVCFVW